MGKCVACVPLRDAEVLDPHDMASYGEHTAIGAFNTRSRTGVEVYWGVGPFGSERHLPYVGQPSMHDLGTQSAHAENLTDHWVVGISWAEVSANS